MSSTAFLVAAEPGPNERTWSVSAANMYRRCPYLWAQCYGVAAAAHQPRENPYESLPRLRGKVLHAGISAAFQAAHGDHENQRHPVGTMEWYWPAARQALGVEWERERMPSDPHEALECTRLLRELLESLPIPTPGSIHSVERRARVRTVGGTIITVRPDYVEWLAPGHLLVVDWKLSAVTTEQVRESRQLRLYALALACLDPTVIRMSIALHSIRQRERCNMEITDDVTGASNTLDWVEATAVTAEADREPATNVGSHCQECQIRPSCPAFP